MFSRLGKAMNDEDKLEILLHNIRPCYASTLSSVNEIKNIEQLKGLCHNYENIQSRLTQFHEPPKMSADTVAPEFVYRNSYYINCNYKKHQNTYNKSFSKSYANNYNNNFSSNNKVISNAAISANSSEKNQQRFCSRCRSYTHSLRECSKPRFIICFKCGKEDVRFPDCPDCNSNPKN